MCLKTQMVLAAEESEVETALAAYEAQFQISQRRIHDRRPEETDIVAHLKWNELG